MPRFFHPDTPDLPLPPGHRFPAGKYRLLRDRISHEGILGRATLVPSPAAGRADLERAHTPGYVAAILDGTVSADIQRRIGLPWSPVLVARSRATVGGSLAAAREALDHGISGQLAGGTHHAHADFGSGYCTFNDLAVAALTLLDEGRVASVAIVDCDVHQGDGNAAILTRDPRALVVSVHGEKNFPFRKVPSDLDVGLPDGTEDRAYLHALAEAMETVAAFRPEIVLYLSGADPLASDTLGRLALTFDGLAERDRFVLEHCRRRGVPVSIAIGGGYAQPIGDSVTAYANTFRVAAELFGL
ncbi:MAG: histone deacetylase [Hyphomicrobiaceae bacterium]